MRYSCLHIESSKGKTGPVYVSGNCSCLTATHTALFTAVTVGHYCWQGRWLVYKLVAGTEHSRCSQHGIPITKQPAWHSYY